MPLKGHRAHVKRLRKLASPAMLRPIGKALFKGGELIQVEAQISITTGAVSGKGHVASLPGQPPSADTHVLANNIETVQKGPLLVEVSSNAPYAHIEWDWAIFVGNVRVGTAAARPYMRPARDKMKAQVVALVTAALNRVVRQSRSTD